MTRRVLDLWAPAIGASGAVLAYGTWGRPVLVFPTEAGKAGDFESNGMVEAVADLLDAGRVKLYCVDSYDSASWSDRSIPLEERARRHGAYESWIVDQVAPWIHDDCGGPRPILTFGASMGAFHAANFALRRADLFPQALCLSGNYDPTTWHGWGEQGDALYFQNPTAYVANLEGDHLAWLRHHVHLTLVCGQGMWEDTTGAQASTRALAGLLAQKDIPHELDVWGHDVAHDWPWWRRQLAHHLSRMA
jgi:esterase/lipase superfamily enzyme